MEWVLGSFEDGSRLIYSQNLNGWQLLGVRSNTSLNQSNYPEIKGDAIETAGEY